MEHADVMGAVKELLVPNVMHEISKRTKQKVTDIVAKPLEVSPTKDDMEDVVENDYQEDNEELEG